MSYSHEISFILADEKVTDFVYFNTATEAEMHARQTAKELAEKGKKIVKRIHKYDFVKCKWYGAVSYR